MSYPDTDPESLAQLSRLWEQFERQRGETLPYLLERCILMANWELPARDDEELAHYGVNWQTMFEGHVRFQGLLIGQMIATILHVLREELRIANKQLQEERQKTRRLQNRITEWIGEGARMQAEIQALRCRAKVLEEAAEKARKELTPWCRDKHYYGGDMEGALEGLEKVLEGG